MQLILLATVFLTMSSLTPASYTLTPDLMESNPATLYACRYFPSSFTLRLKVGLLAAKYNKTVFQLFSSFSTFSVRLTGYNLNKKSTQLIFNNQTFTTSNNVYSRFGVKVPTSDIWEFNFVSDGSIKLQNSLPFKITFNLGGVNNLSGTYTNKPSALPLDIQAYSISGTNALGNGCLNLEFNNTCSFIDSSTVIMLSSASYNGPDAPLVSLWSKENSVLCENVTVAGNTSPLMCNEISEFLNSTLNPALAIQNIFYNRTSLQTISMQACNLILPPSGDSLNLKVTLKGITNLATANIIVASNDPVDLKLNLKRFDEALIGRPFNLEADFSVEAYVIEPLAHILDVKFPVALQALSNISIEFTNYADNSKQLFSNLQLSSAGNVQVNLNSAILNYYQGFAVRIFGYDTPSASGNHVIGIQLLNMDQTAVSLVKNVPFEIKESIDDLVVLLSDDYPNRPTDATLITNLFVLDGSAQNVHLIINLESSLVLANNSSVQVEAVENMVFASFDYDIINHRIILNNAFWTQTSELNQISKFVVKGLKIADNAGNDINVSVDVEIDGQSNWHKNYSSKVRQIHLSMIEALADYPEKLNLNIKLQLDKEVSFSHLLRVTLPDDVNQGTVSAFLADSNPFFSFVGFRQLQNLSVNIDQASNKRFITIPGVLDNLKKNNPYNLRLELDNPNMSSSSVQVTIDVLPLDSAFDEHDYTTFFSNAVIADIEIEAPINCVHWDLNSGLYKVCVECSQGYSSDQTGQCISL